MNTDESPRSNGFIQILFSPGINLPSPHDMATGSIFYKSPPTFDIYHPQQNGIP